MTNTLFDTSAQSAAIPDAPAAIARQKGISGAFRRELKRIGTFGLVGIVNTGIDFGLLNFFHFHVGLGLIAANLLSTTVAMIFSFFANRHVVFRSTGQGTMWRQAVWFWAITASSLYLLQSAIIWLFSHPFNGAALQFAHDVQRVTPSLGTRFITTNGIKIVATAASLVWNYSLYKKFVFVTCIPKPEAN